MPSVALSPIGNGVTFFNAAGSVLQGGKINTYAAGTSTATGTYTSSAGTVLNSNPVILGSAGVTPNAIWLIQGTAYKFVITDASNNVLMTIDNIQGINDAIFQTDTEWLPQSTPTYISATSFSVVGNQTSTFDASRRVKSINTGGTVYSGVSSQSYSAGPNTTTVGLTNDSGSLDSGLSAVFVGIVDPANPSFVLNSTTIFCTTSGTANAIVLTPNTATVRAMSNYMRFSFVANFTSSGPVTLQIATLSGVLNVVSADTSYLINSYDINNGFFYEVVYVNGVFQLVSSSQSSGQAMTNEATVRIASNATAKQYQTSYYDGNGLYLWNAGSIRWEFHRLPGSFGTIDTTNCTINGTTGQALIASTRYYIYAYISAGAIAFDHSTTVPVSGDPLGSTSVTGYLFKTGDISRRLVGGVGTDGSQVIWASGGSYPNGVKQSNIGSYYQRQRLNLQIVPSGSALSNTSWATLTNAKLSAWLWGDGAEPSCTAMLSIQGNTAGTTVSVGISVDGESPPGSFQAFVVPSNNYGVAVTLNCPSGNLPDGVHTFEIKAMISSGAATYTVTGAPAFTLNVNQ
jgi:hypothetical protein